jgi:hypothetical protein
MPSCGMLRCVALLRTDVLEERRASNIRVTRIGDLGITLTLTSNRCTLRSNTMCSVHRLLVKANVVRSTPILVTLIMQALRSYETSVLTRVKRRNIPPPWKLQILHTEWAYALSDMAETNRGRAVCYN